MLTLARFLRSHREQILQAWDARTRTLASAQGLDRTERRDHIPQLLDALALAIERHDTGKHALQHMPEVHADHRWAQSYDLRDVVTEYRLLRRVILDIYTEHGGGLSEASRARMPALVTLGENIDHAIADAVDHYMRQRDRTREYFIGMLSHDLRDPLNVIAMNAEMAMRAGAEVDTAPLFARIAANAARMRHLIDDMLDVTRSRLGAGLPVAPVPMALDAVVRQAADSLGSMHPHRRIALEIAAECAGTWDPMRIEQAVGNLIANALRHGADPVVARCHADGDDVVLEVANGGEVPPAMREHLFEPFVSGDPGGTGLGLYIVAEIARAHGGELSLRPDTPGRTCLRLRLPRRPPVVS